MKTSDFDYDLDESLIAQHPEEHRADCKLMVMDRDTGALEHDHFYNLKKYLNPGDLLVLNNTKVLPARLYGHRPDKEESIEVLLLTNHEGKIWECLVKPGRKMKVGQEIIFSDKLQARVRDILEEGQRLIELDYEGPLEPILDQLGNMPIPPYITEELKDNDDYQTVYAKVSGSAAAPTAGLHFTEELLEELRDYGVNLAYVTLHVGLGTFRPVHVEDITDHEMHAEFYMISQESADIINQTKEAGKRVISVGTTTIRTLESVYKKNGQICKDSGWTDIFIYPGYEYKVIDGIITNFHLPKSTLIMMISAFAGKDHVMEAYQAAQDKAYRFFSFGDAMLILDRSE